MRAPLTARHTKADRSVFVRPASGVMLGRAYGYCPAYKYCPVFDAVSIALDPSDCFPDTRVRM